MNKVTNILLLFSILFFPSCIVTNKQYLSLEKEINDNKTDTIIFKNFLIINNDNTVKIEKYKKGVKNGKIVGISKTADGKIGEYNVCKYKNGTMKGTFRVYSSNGKLLRKIKMKNGKPMNVVSPRF